MLPFGKWITKSPFPVKSQIKYVHTILIQAHKDQFCFQCGQKGLPMPDLHGGSVAKICPSLNKTTMA
jgi:hypothetical protein